MPFPAVGNVKDFGWSWEKQMEKHGENWSHFEMHTWRQLSKRINHFCFHLWNCLLTACIFPSFNRVQRSNYADHKILALRNDDWLTMVIDGMDQAKTNVPRFAKEDKLTASLPKIITHITGDCHPFLVSLLFLFMVLWKSCENMVMRKSHQLKFPALCNRSEWTVMNKRSNLSYACHFLDFHKLKLTRVQLDIRGFTSLQI